MDLKCRYYGFKTVDLEFNNLIKTLDNDLKVKKVMDLRVGDLVDLTSCPYLYKDTSAEYMLAEVLEIEKETPNCTVVHFDGFKSVGYPTEQELLVNSEEEHYYVPVEVCRS